MEIITLNEKNIAEEHICCAFSDKKCSEGYHAKKDWLKDRFTEGYQFKKFDVRHKVFIEYGPSESSWLPIEAKNYMVIGCYWVAGSYKGNGYGKELLQECIKDSEGKDGIVVLSSKKKMPFLADKKFFLKNGFEVCDSAQPYYELLVKRNNEKGELPKFRENAKNNLFDGGEGISVFYSNQCPFTEYYVNVELKGIAHEYGIPIHINKIENREMALDNPSASTIYSIFHNGKYVTHEILSRKKFEKLFL